MPAMENVLTLIAGSVPLDHSIVAAARAALGDCGQTGAPDWLAEKIACDIPFDGMAPGAAAGAARAALGDAPVDLVAQPARERRKKLLVADMESTIIDNEMVDELAAVLGLHDEVAAITARSMRGELDFAESLRERVGMLAGLDAGALEGLFDAIVVNPGAVELVATMRAHGGFCVLVSGGFTVYSNYVRALVGFDRDQANRLEIEAGRLTGRVAEPILDRQSKRQCLEDLTRELGLSAWQTIAVGDGANDLEMVGAAGLGVAYHAKPVLANNAGMRVDHGDLTALLYAQGYRTDEIVRPG